MARSSESKVTCLPSYLCGFKMYANIYNTPLEIQGHLQVPTSKWLIQGFDVGHCSVEVFPSSIWQTALQAASISEM